MGTRKLLIGAKKITGEGKKAHRGRGKSPVRRGVVDTAEQGSRKEEGTKQTDDVFEKKRTSGASDSKKNEGKCLTLGGKDSRRKGSDEQERDYLKGRKARGGSGCGAEEAKREGSK